MPLKDEELVTELLDDEDGDTEKLDTVAYYKNRISI